MEKKRKRRPRFYILLGLSALVLVLGFFVAVNLPRPQQVSDANIHFDELADGTYEGVCDNGMVFVRVAVDIERHTIAQVRVLEHRNGMGQPAEKIADTVTQRQSVQVDAVTGATLSSQTILKAIENAIGRKEGS